MKRFPGRLGIGRTLAGGAVVAGASAMLLAGPAAGSASAAPAATAKVPGTSCSLAQVEKAVAKEDPAMWKKLEANPKAKQRFEERMTKTGLTEKAHPKHKKGQHKPGEQKKAPTTQQGKKHAKPTPEQRAKRSAEMKALKAKIVATCSKY